LQTRGNNAKHGSVCRLRTPEETTNYSHDALADLANTLVNSLNQNPKYQVLKLAPNFSQHQTPHLKNSGLNINPLLSAPLHDFLWDSSRPLMRSRATEKKTLQKQFEMSPTKKLAPSLYDGITKVGPPRGLKKDKMSAHRETNCKISSLLLNQNEQDPFLLLNSWVHSYVWLLEVKKRLCKQR
jgi:hypothetical protein